jgi:hypothetical protein
MSTVRGGTSDCRAFGCNNQRLVSQVTNVIPRLRSRRWQPPGMSAAAANDRSLRRWVGTRHRNHRNEPAGKTTIRLSGPTGSSDSSRPIRVRVRSARRVENHLSSLVWRVHWDEPIQTQVTYGYMYPVHRDPSGHNGGSAPRPSNAAPPTPRGLRAATARQQPVHRAQRHQPRAIPQSHRQTRERGCNGAAATRSFGRNANIPS